MFEILFIGCKISTLSLSLLLRDLSRDYLRFVTVQRIYRARYFITRMDDHLIIASFADIPYYFKNLGKNFFERAISLFSFLHWTAAVDDLSRILCHFRSLEENLQASNSNEMLNLIKKWRNVCGLKKVKKKRFPNAILETGSDRGGGRRRISFERHG